MTRAEQIEEAARIVVHHRNNGAMRSVGYGINDLEKALALPQDAEPEPDYWIDEVLCAVAELPDRTSPDDWPDAMLVTAEELRAILKRRLHPPTPASERHTNIARSSFVDMSNAGVTVTYTSPASVISSAAVPVNALAKHQRTASEREQAQGALRDAAIMTPPPAPLPEPPIGHPLREAWQDERNQEAVAALNNMRLNSAPSTNAPQVPTAQDAGVPTYTLDAIVREVWRVSGVPSWLHRAVPEYERDLVRAGIESQAATIATLKKQYNELAEKCDYWRDYAIHADFSRESAAEELKQVYAECAALRELLNCYNLGGWMDSERLMAERDAAREDAKRYMVNGAALIKRLCDKCLSREQALMEQSK